MPSLYFAVRTVIFMFEGLVLVIEFDVLLVLTGFSFMFLVVKLADAP